MFLPKMHILSYKETSHVATLGDILQDNWLVFFKNIQVMNVRGCWGLCQESQVRQHVHVARDKFFHSLGRYWETWLNVKGVWRLEGSKGSVLISWFQWSPCGYVEFCIWRKLTKVLEGTRPATYAQREKVCMFDLQLFLILLSFQNKELF